MILADIWALLVYSLSFIITLAKATPLESRQHVRRATQVSLINYSYSNNVLSGSINVSSLIDDSYALVRYNTDILR